MAIHGDLLLEAWMDPGNPGRGVIWGGLGGRRPPKEKEKKKKRKKKKKKEKKKF